jgi:hypothetical protein
MRVALITACLAAIAAPAWARVAPRMPHAMEQAPVERALENVRRDERLPPAQRERLLGRLHLIAYAQLNAPVTLYSNGEWHGEIIDSCPNNADSCGSERRVRFGVELPVRASFWSFTARGHLITARTHYERALALDDSDLRAHLGLAYIFDELNQDDAARSELRRIIELSDAAFMRQDNGEIIWWDRYAVLSEAIDHLAYLAHSAADRRSVASLRRRLGNARHVTVVTPIVVPLADASFDALTNPSSPVAFDFAGTGDTRARGWLTADAAWLVWDPEGLGEVRSGFDMLGQRTWAVFWTDGFEAMRSLDDNRDGALTGAELGGLALWRDVNVNGISDAGEVAPVSAFGITGLAVNGREEMPGLLVAPAGVDFVDGTRRPLYDWTPGVAGAPSS